MTDASKVLDDAKYSGTKEVDESLQIDAAKLQPWIDAYIPNEVLSQLKHNLF